MAKRVSVWSCGCAQVGDKLKEKTKPEKDPIDLYSEECTVYAPGHSAGMV